jgi:hypothetical protein
MNYASEGKASCCLSSLAPGTNVSVCWAGHALDITVKFGFFCKSGYSTQFSIEHVMDPFTMGGRFEKKSEFKGRTM